MTRKSLICLLLCLVLFAPGALAASGNVTEIPTKEDFSLAHARLDKAIYRERPVTWRATITPTALDGYEGGAMTAMAAMMSSLELSGTLQCFKEGGMLEASLISGGREIATFGQMAKDDRTAINLTGEWYSTTRGMEQEAASSLGLDDFGISLLNMDYDGMRAGDIPFLSAIYREGMKLWGLASPYSEDSNRLSVPSGATGHGVTYEIDTQGLRTMLREWSQGLKNEGFSLGFAGTDLSLGISDEAFDAFVVKAQAFAETAELSKPIKFSTTFGEGDVLRTAKGSGTLQADGKRSNISYNYSCNLSNTRITRKYSIDFQPRNADTLVLSCTWVTSSNNQKSGAEEVTITASGVYDGEPYRIKINSSMVNKYAVGDDGILHEQITGTVTGSLKYADVLVADVTVKRDGQNWSTTGLTTGIRIEDSYDITVKNSETTLFAGVLNMAYEVADGTQETPDVLADAHKLEEMDFMDLESLRASMGDALSMTEEKLMQSLPLAAMEAILASY